MAYNIERMTPGDAAYMLGQLKAKKLGGGYSSASRHVNDVLTRFCLEVGMLRKCEPYRMHDVWVIVSPDVELMPGPWVGFSSRSMTWVYWLGLGGPVPSEIRLLVDPLIESAGLEDAFKGKMIGALEDIERQVVDGGEAPFRVIAGGKDAGEPSRQDPEAPRCEPD